MPRYELKDDKSSKFWEIEVDGNRYEVCYGRIGSKGQRSTKEFDTAAQAQAAAEKITASKLAKGYQAVAEERHSTTVGVRNPELEQVLRQNPSDVDNLLVYADYLQEHNDPFGRLLAFAIAAGQDPGSPQGKAARREYDRVFAANKQQWLGIAADWLDRGDALALTWQHGCVTQARVGYAYDEESPATAVLVKALLHSPVCRFLQSLTIAATEGVQDGYVYFGDCIDELLGAETPPPLRSLTIGDCYPPEADLSWLSIGDCSGIFSVFPQLEYFRTRGSGVRFDRLRHANLKALTVESGGLESDAVVSIANARLPALESLEVWFGSAEYGADSDISMLEPLLRGKGFPALKHLGLMNSEFEDEIVQALAGAPILKQLKTLDLSMGTMSDTGATVLLEHAGAFQHLEHIDLEQNFIGEQTARKLRKLFKSISVKHQSEPYDWDDEPHYYVSASE